MTTVYFTKSEDNVQIFKNLSRGDYFFFKDEDEIWLKTDVNQAVCVDGGNVDDDLDGDDKVTPIKTIEIIFEV